MKNKNFYSVTLGQLVTIWVFGVIASFLLNIESSSDSNPNVLYFILAISIIFFLIFYTIGWKANKINQK